MDRSLVPNATQFPNILTDQVMPLVSGSEWKVIHYGVRHTLGHGSEDTLTIAQIAHGRQAEDGTWLDRGTGLSEDEVKECLAFLCDEVHLFLRQDRPRKPHGFRLNPDLSSINWTALEQRRRGVVAAPEPERLAAGPTVFVEVPQTDVRLDGSDRPVTDVLRENLSPEEARSFDHLLALVQTRTNIGLEDMAAWQLYKLWRTYGFRRLQNALRSPEPINSLDDANHACLVGVLAEMLEKERFGVLSPTFREQILEMAREWPNLSDWQEAIATAVRINKRRLQTVETILKNKQTPPVESQGVKPHARTTAPARSRQRPARRQSDWDEGELRAAREAERDKEWTPPPS